jgi:hypothetical protein
LFGEGAVKGFALDAGFAGNGGHCAGLGYILESLEEGFWGVFEGGVKIRRGFVGIEQRS